MDKFCQDDFYKEIAKILKSNKLFTDNVNIVEYYENMKRQYNADEDEILENLKLKNIDVFYNFLKAKINAKEDLKHIGIDFPIYFGSLSENNNKIMIVAMDPKRDEGGNEIVSLNSMFSLHSKKEGRETKKQDYWKFIKPILKNNFVYLTDVYKLYYLTSKLNKKRERKPLLSNEDDKYTTKTIHSEILIEEILLVKPKLIIAYGNKAREECAKILGIELKNKITTDYVRDGYKTSIESSDKSKVVETKFIAIPHPSKRTWQVAWDCFLCKNKLDEELSKEESNTRARVNATVKIIQELMDK